MLHTTYYLYESEISIMDVKELIIKTNYIHNFNEKNNQFISRVLERREME